MRPAPNMAIRATAAIQPRMEPLCLRGSTANTPPTPATTRPRVRALPEEPSSCVRMARKASPSRVTWGALRRTM